MNFDEFLAFMLMLERLNAEQCTVRMLASARKAASKWCVGGALGRGGHVCESVCECVCTCHLWLTLGR